MPVNYLGTVYHNKQIFLNGADLGVQPTVAGLSLVPEFAGNVFTLTFNLNSVAVPITDAAASGSHGSLKLFDFVEQAFIHLGTRQKYTAFAEGALLTGAAGDAAFKIGVGTAAVAAPADNALTGPSVDIGKAVAITLAGGTGAGAALDGASVTAIDGTSAAKSLYLNVSGSAATIDASDDLYVTGTIKVTGVFLGA